MQNIKDTIGVVVIGRNEGERLKACFSSLPTELPTVYVDSGSSDGSVEFAQGIGVEVVALDMSIPFTAARARNAGWQRLLKIHPTVQYVQFIDGDCELIENWLELGLCKLEQDATLAIVYGRTIEKAPHASLYNQLADMGWRLPVQNGQACGGIALIRVEALQTVNGFDNSLICGEEPEMCLRMRRLGWRILWVDVPMTYHDMAMYRFSQWWKRMVREGWGIAEGFARYGQAQERYMARRYYSGWFWGLILPGLVLLLSWSTHALSLFLLLGYLFLALRIYTYRRQQGDSPKNSRLYAQFITISKFPQVIGHLRYWLAQWQQKAPQIIEYKAVAPDSSS
jgi:GT2 family glycosyltransferase